LLITSIVCLGGCSIQFTGLFSNMAFENGQVTGLEVFVVPGPGDEYFALVQCSDGQLGTPSLVSATRDAHRIVLAPITDPASRCPSSIFRAEIGPSAMSGGFQGYPAVQLRRGKSVWQ
jgi:hypothetical protein